MRDTNRLTLATDDRSEEPLDNTYLYNKLGVAGMRDYLSDKAVSGSFYRSEPYFGYYMNTDSWVKRKHAYMLEAAGVDFIFVDLGNGATYDAALICQQQDCLQQGLRLLRRLGRGLRR